MNKLDSAITWARARVFWLALAALPLIIAACNNGGGAPGY
jgi:hypothetical protein